MLVKYTIFYVCIDQSILWHFTHFSKINTLVINVGGRDITE